MIQESAAPRILVADDHSVVRRGLRALLEAEPGWEVCAEAATGREAVALAIEHHPDVVVLDLGMPELDGMDAARRIREVSPSTKILLFTMHDSDDTLRDALHIGVDGLLLKTDADRELVGAVRTLLRGHRYFSHRMGSDLAGSEDPPRLTPREREVLRLVAQGLSTKEVATALGIGAKTADTHRTNVMQKLGVHSVADLVRYAIRNRIIHP